MIQAIDSKYLLQTLPPKPEYFDRDLANIGRRNNVPVFRCVDGQREKKWRNGKWDVKHLLQGVSYIPVIVTGYRRKNVKTGEYVHYSTYKAAKNDKTKGLSFEIEEGRKVEVRAVGRPCWVIEVYVPPEEIDYDTWQAQRFQYLSKNGVEQKVDQLGEFPKDGMYIACFDVVDDEGNAVSPSDKTLDECRKRLKLAEEDTLSLEETLAASEAREKEFERRQLERLNQNVFDAFGLAATTRARAGVIGKPIVTVKK